MMIVSVVQFVIERASQIMDFVEAVINSINAIATGSIGGAANWIEKSLGNMVPILIGFLAALVGLGGLAAKVKAFIVKVQSKVDKAIDKALKKIVDFVKKLFGKLKAKAKALAQWWKKKSPFTGGGESHTVQFQGGEDSAQLVVKSAPKKPEEFILDYVPAGKKSEEAGQVKSLSKEIDALKQKVAAAQKKDPPDEAAIAKHDGDLTLKFNALGAVLAAMLDKAEDEGSAKRPLPADYPKRRAAAYPNIYVGPLTSQRIPQSTLKAVAAAGGGKSAKDALAKAVPQVKKEAGFKSWSGAVKVFRAATPGQALPGGGAVGLDAAFASLAPGKVLVYDEKGSTGGGGKINNMFKPYGFRAGSEGLDGDHVMERQLGGPDAINNLWPLPSGENRSSGSKVKSMKVEFKGEPTTVHVARKKRKNKALHLLIKSTV
jgi:hypothetical protein